ncbi:MAG TPA: ATP-binding protein [Thermoanaerobaculia bacterium]|nr:ATP-binding protein [Thermoanaerobaculia bacterium]
MMPAELPLSIAAVLFTLLTIGALAAWARRRRRTGELVQRARRALELPETAAIEPERFAGPLADLARVLEEGRRASVELRKRAAEQERVRGRILEGIGEGILAIDRRKNVVLANRKFRELFDLERSPIGVPFYQAVRNSRLHAALQGALEGRTEVTLIPIRTEVSERQAEVHVVPIPDDAEIAAVAVFIDVTRLVRLERVRRDFLTDFSHEVRTPLAGLRSAIETLEGGRVSAEDEEQLRRIAIRQLARLERLVEDVSELNRIESGELELQKQDVDLLELLRDLADDFRDLAASSGIEIAIEGEPVRELADAQRIEQVISNLLDNAIKFSPRGSRVTLAAGRTAEGSVITVRDQGEGITPEEQARIFHRFYRVDRSRSQRVPGSGLGLSIAKHLTALHGGRIEVESEPGRGATFRVVLPAAAGAEGLAHSRNG